jgi:hypothetical protein
MSDIAKNARRFRMYRKKDSKKVSGSGWVLDGVLWHTGKVTVCWRTDISLDTKVKVSSIAIYDSLEDFLKLHVELHPKNGTEIVWLDE